MKANSYIDKIEIQYLNTGAKIKVTDQSSKVTKDRVTLIVIASPKCAQYDKQHLADQFNALLEDLPRRTMKHNL
jgi:hypothetical protein